MGIKYKVNENFFSSWGSEMAYVLGFWFADGSLEDASYLRGKYIRVTSTDKYIVETIKDALESEHKIVKVQSTKKQRYLLRIGNHKMFASLLTLGLTPRKSLTMRFPLIPTNYLGPFVRGYLDGDGSVQLERARGSKKQLIVKRLGIFFTSGSAEFLKEMSIRLSNEWSLTHHKPYPGSRSFQLRYSTADSIKLFERLYQDLPTKLFLKRKFARFEEYFKLRPQRISRNAAKILSRA